MISTLLAVLFAFVEIPDTPQINDSFLGEEHVDGFVAEHPFVGLTHQDAIILTNADSNLYSEHPMTMQRHLKALYGAMWRRQAKRALVERCERLVEDVQGICTWCDHDPRNLICRPPDCPLETYRNWSSRNQRLWYVVKDGISKSELHKNYHNDNSYFVMHNPIHDHYTVCRWVVSPMTHKYATNRGWFSKNSGLRYYFFIDKNDTQGAMDYLLDPDQRVNPIYHQRIIDNFKKRVSFAVPIYGSYIFDTHSVFEEFSHQLNVGVLKTEWRTLYDTPADEFPENYRYITKWTEFLVGYAGAKQDAFERLGIDVGLQGGFEQYYSAIEKDVDNLYRTIDMWGLSSNFIEWMSRNGSKNSIFFKVATATSKLLLAYRWALTVEHAQTTYGEPVPVGVARFLSWCRNPAIGRMVL